MDSSEAEWWSLLSANVPPGFRVGFSVPLFLLLEVEGGGRSEQDLLGAIVPFVVFTPTGYASRAIFLGRDDSVDGLLRQVGIEVSYLEGPPTMETARRALGIKSREREESLSTIEVSHPPSAPLVIAPPKESSTSSAPEPAAVQDTPVLRKGEDMVREFSRRFWSGEVGMLRLSEELVAAGQEAAQSTPALSVPPASPSGQDPSSKSPPRKGSAQPGTREVSSSAASSISASYSPPACPRCGKPMQLKVARKGKAAGSQFWSCTGYPECKGTRPFHPRPEGG